MSVTETLIDDLAESLQPCKSPAHPLVRVLPWVFLALAYMTGVVNYLGIRPDLVHKFKDSTFLFEIGAMAAVSFSAAMASAWLCVPDMRGAKWLVAVPLTLLGTFVFWCGVRAHVDGFALPAMHWDHCFNDAMLMGLVPAAAVIFMSRGGATTRPLLMGMMNALSVGALGYVGLRFTCMLDTLGHAGLYHLLPFIVFGALLGGAARFVFRW